MAEAADEAPLVRRHDKTAELEVKTPHEDDGFF